MNALLSDRRFGALAVLCSTLAAGCAVGNWDRDAARDTGSPNTGGDAGSGDTGRGDAQSVDAGSDARSDALPGSDGGTSDVPLFDPTPVRVVITADNAYRFGYGSRTALANYFGGVENVGGEQIFNCPIGNGPEEYVVPGESASAGSFVYIITWSDRSVTQGVLAEFQRGTSRKIYTGDPNFEVCATGVEFMLGSLGPSLEQVNEQITRCNAGGPDGVVGGAWYRSTGSSTGALAIGEDNSTEQVGGVQPGNEFPLVCGIDSAAKWMWFNWSPSTIRWPTEGSPFMYPAAPAGMPDENITRQFLIFRLSTLMIPG